MTERWQLRCGDTVRALRDGPARIDGRRLANVIEAGGVYLVADIKRGNLHLEGGDIFRRLAIAALGIGWFIGTFIGELASAAAKATWKKITDRRHK